MVFILMNSKVSKYSEGIQCIQDTPWRHSDKVARESLPKYRRHGWDDVTKEVINYFYGWCLKEMSKDMQLHYAGMDRFARRCLAKVSMFF